VWLCAKSADNTERNKDMKEKLIAVGSYLLAAAVSVTALVAVSELSVAAVTASANVEGGE
jgi:hypothetical protein